MADIAELGTVRAGNRRRNLDTDVAEGADNAKHGSVSVRELKLSCRVKAHAFWATGTKAKNKGSAVQD
jgi:hypothetical protein